MAAIDDLGFVTIDEIQNIFATETQKFEEDIRKNGVPLEERHAITWAVEWLDHVRLKLHQRARVNMDAYVKGNPGLKREAMEVKAKEYEAESTKSWEERVKANRTAAINDCYK